MITSKEAVWLPYIVDWKDVGIPIWKENTHDWIKEALYLFQHKKTEKFIKLLEEHGIIEPEKE
ncbi:MAG: hypothetical protein IKO57_07210 [Treponema sp.]|nr:hypothetical protein [Treponema sp.]